MPTVQVLPNATGGWAVYCTQHGVIPVLYASRDAASFYAMGHAAHHHQRPNLGASIPA